MDPLPDTDEVFGEIFQQLTYPKMGRVETDNGTGIIADPTVDPYVTNWNPMLIALDKIDPLEAHRFTINQYLLRSGTVAREDIEWVSPQNVREFICCYFRHFHRHASTSPTGRSSCQSGAPDIGHRLDSRSPGPHRRETPNSPHYLRKRIN